MKLQTKIWLASSLVILAITVGDFIASRALIEESIRTELERDARDVRAMLMAMRRVYHQQFIASGLPVNDKTIGFLPAHALSRVAADFPNWSHSGLWFNNVTDRPRNPKNQADAHELAAMAWFREHPEAQERLAEIRDAGGRDFYHYTAPIWIEPYCLQCHGERAEAPASVAQSYDMAYGYKVGDLRGVMSIKLPTDGLRARAHGEWRQRFMVRLVGYVALLVLIGSLVNLLVTRRLALLQQSARALEGGDYSARCPVAGDDEVAALGRSFNAMAEAIESDSRELAKHRVDLEAMLSERTQDLRRTNDELRHARDAAEAGSHAKSAFLANMSHEIRTPINAITGMAYLMRRDDALPPKQAERLEKIDVAAHHLLGVINDVLDISKIEAGRLDLEAVPVQPAAILDNVASMVGERARAKGLQLRVERDALPGDLLGDPTRLTQALLNYAGNAVKFAEKGSVTLRLRLLEERDDSVAIRYEVEDTGPGIDAETCARLFRAFEQADGSTTRRYGGTGLGLAITRRLAELMEGAADVDSVPGSGSTFWFTARLRRGRGASLPAVVARDAVGAEERLVREFAGRRVLLVEDDIVNREVALELLADLAFEVDIASDGTQAVNRAASVDYDLILMDLQMPGIDGVEAARRIRALPRGERPSIVAMTANVFQEDRERCADVGMDDFIAKPIDPEAMFATLLAQLERRAGGPAG